LRKFFEHKGTTYFVKWDNMTKNCNIYEGKDGQISEFFIDLSDFK